MDDTNDLTHATEQIAAAIGRRDVEGLSGWLAPGFVARTPGGGAQQADAFLEAVRGIPGEIVFVHVEKVTVDLGDAAALVTGVQHARVRIDGTDVDDRRGFIDWFVRHGGQWRIRVAVDLPSASGT